jgi:outer membrane receptor protein involved in Fe transport
MRFGRFVFNLGGMVEHEPSNLDDPAFSPRIGVNYRLTGNTSIRAVLSRSVRTPDILEYDRDWSYRLDSTDPYPLDGQTSKYFYFNSKSDGKIKSEEILAREISLFHSSSINLDRGKLLRSFDFKFFRNNLDNLVSEKLQFFDYNPTNDGEVRLTGFEFEADFKFENYFLPEYVEYVSAHMNYAYIDNDTDEFFETSLHADHSGAAYIIARAKAGYFGSLAYYGNSDIQGESADAYEFGLGRDFRFNTGTFTLKGKVVYRPDKVEEFTSSETFAVKNIYSDSTSFFITAEYRLK